MSESLGLKYRDWPVYNQYQANNNSKPICIPYSYSMPKSFQFNQELVELKVDC